MLDVIDEATRRKDAGKQLHGREAGLVIYVGVFILVWCTKVGTTSGHNLSNSELVLNVVLMSAKKNIKASDRPPTPEEFVGGIT